MKLSVIIPVFNEEKTVEEIINKVVFVSLPIEKEIIVVDDGSTDNTRKILGRLQRRLGFIYLEHQINQGKGAAIKTALSRAAGDFTLIQDADLEYNPEEYPLLIGPLLNGKADAVYGSRNISSNPRFKKLYFWGGKFLTMFFNLLFNAKLTDINTGYKVFKREILQNLGLKEKRFSFCEEVTCKLIEKGYIIKEVPIHYSPRGFKDGKKIRWWKDGARGMMTILKHRLRLV